MKLSKELSRRGTGRTLYILDEPTTGLHFEDTHKLLDVLNKLVDQGNTVVIIEHNLDVIKSADHVIDLGPEGGEGGGKIIAKGTPEDVAQEPESFTGRFLADSLRRHPGACKVRMQRCRDRASAVVTDHTAVGVSVAAQPATRSELALLWLDRYH